MSLFCKRQSVFCLYAVLGFLKFQKTAVAQTHIASETTDRYLVSLFWEPNQEAVAVNSEASFPHHLSVAEQLYAADGNIQSSDASGLKQRVYKGSSKGGCCDGYRFRG
ncbi:hypothetical protein B0H19DRAFT_1231059 [Mycena capillaripes]|nr:hypothetical protein B0H19DRAFT_1231059 [Mycena capillaripes]